MIRNYIKETRPETVLQMASDGTGFLFVHKSNDERLFSAADSKLAVVFNDVL